MADYCAREDFASFIVVLIFEILESKHIINGETVQNLSTLTLTEMDAEGFKANIKVNLATFEDSFRLAMHGENGADKVVLSGVDREETDWAGTKYFFTGADGQEPSPAQP